MVTEIRRGRAEPLAKGAQTAMATATRKLKPVRQGQDAEPELSSEEMLKLYRDMLLIRRFEEKAGQMYGMGLIGGFCPLYIGQVAGVCGVKMVLKACEG